MRAISLGALLAVLAASPAAADGVWDGFYAGGHAGMDWSRTAVTDNINPSDGVPPGPFKFTGTGYFGGVTLGYNYQFGPFVFGVESDIGYASRMASGIIPSSNPSYHQDAKVNEGLYADITGRAGIAIGPTGTLVYAKGGAIAFGGESAQVTTKPGYTPTSNMGFPGIVYGGGIEQSLGHRWTVKVEYLHASFWHRDSSQTSLTDPPVGYVYTNRFALDADTVKVGFNYSF